MSLKRLLAISVSSLGSIYIDNAIDSSANGAVERFACLLLIFHSPVICSYRASYLPRHPTPITEYPPPEHLRQNPMKIKITKETDVHSTNLLSFLPLFLGSRRLASLNDEFLPEGMPKETNERTREATVRTYVHTYSVGLGVPFRCQFPWQITALPLFGITRELWLPAMRVHPSNRITKRLLRVYKSIECHEFIDLFLQS